MTFWEHFLRLLPWRPWQALAALYWQVTRRKVRARNLLREGSQKLPFVYDLWIPTVERNSELARNVEAIMDGWARRPSFSIILHSTGHTKQQLARSIRSVERQIYPDWTLVDQTADPIEIPTARGDANYVVPLRVGDELSQAALFHFAQSFQSNQSAPVFYGDQDELSGRGRRTCPWFKPRWNGEMFLALDFLLASVAIEAGLACKVGLCSETLRDTDLPALLLAATSMAEGHIVHVPHVLCHVEAGRAYSGQSARLAAVARYLDPLGAACRLGPFGTIKVDWPLPSELPLVSIIVPIRDRIDLLRACLGSVLGRTSYKPIEILIVDNGSTEPQTLAYLAEISGHPAIRVIHHDEPYNFSALNNLAARTARGSYLCLLNNDTEVIEPDWLTEMMRYAVRSDVGAVGAKLLYPDGSIQHAGVVVGMGDAAGHAHRFTAADEPGYFRQAHVAQFVSAVTAACLVVDKSKFEAVGGLDEQELAIAYNDVDLCLKLEAAGWRNVYVPHAILLHHESKSRGNDVAPEQIDRYMRELRVLQERWETKTYKDPLHNPNLDRYSETFVPRL